MLMLRFYVGAQAFACEGEPIWEVVPRVKLKKISQMPPFLEGILNMGGIPVPVIDFAQLIDDRPSQNSLHTRIILFKHPQEENETQPALGIVAEKVLEVLQADRSEFLDTGLHLEKFPYLAGVFQSHGQSIQLVLIEELFAYLGSALEQLHLSYGQ